MSLLKNMVLLNTLSNLAKAVCFRGIIFYPRPEGRGYSVTIYNQTTL